MNKKEQALNCVNALKNEYPDSICSLEASNPFELLVATRLSAQCTDARVNLVTPALFERYKTLQDYADADVKDIEALIRSCGFYHTKAADIVGMAKMLTDEFGGVIPDTVEELTRLPGVGRKTANLICGDLYGKPAYVCDTHVIRLTNRIGFVKTKDAAAVEKKLMCIIPPEESLNFCHRLVWHGRLVCNARKPECEKCCISHICSFYKGIYTQISKDHTDKK